MFSFTEQERHVLLVLMLIILVGTSLHLAFKKYPHLKDMVNLIDGEDIYLKTDINTASYQDLIAIPYIGPATADQILAYRQKTRIF